MSELEDPLLTFGDLEIKACPYMPKGWILIKTPKFWYLYDPRNSKMLEIPSGTDLQTEFIYWPKPYVKGWKIE